MVLNLDRATVVYGATSRVTVNYANIIARISIIALNEIKTYETSKNRNGEWDLVNFRLHSR